MDNQIKDAFSAIQASDRLKRKTRAVLRKKTFDYGRNLYRIRQHRRRLATGLLSLVLVLSTMGMWFLPVTAIGLSVNPSIELLVNTLDRVIGVKGINSDGLELVRNLDVYGLTYDEAMHRILICDEMAPYMDENSMISITVIDDRDNHAEKMLSKVVCRAYSVAEKENVQYYQIDHQTQKAAEAAGLCVPRYLAWQYLRKSDPGMTAEDVRELPKEEIHRIVQYDTLEDPCGYGKGD